MMLEGKHRLRKILTFAVVLLLIGVGCSFGIAIANNQPIREVSYRVEEKSFGFVTVFRDGPTLLTYERYHIFIRNEDDKPNVSEIVVGPDEIKFMIIDDDQHEYVNRIKKFVIYTDIFPSGSQEQHEIERYTKYVLYVTKASYDKLR